ncbi:hypothetical protein FNT36_18575 [Hymenobacter setariae]|uniref:Uncharacterized protein n=1 Tax=Hymenobacter setariae TaxID=2594794 RepID=A0A558BT07_9BACT|nr:hypothetical protein [Hymenobacter setariae]TVT39647.1 hypothetical protein FNT36_18575 [Hymenobacter setariae]
MPLYDMENPAISCLLLFALYTILSAAQQGIITWLFREYVPPARTDWVHAALHYGGVLIYLLIICYLVYLTPDPSPLGVGVLLAEATAARALLFDPCLSLSQSWFNYREGRPAEPLFKVGTVALLDKMLRSVAARLSWPPERLRLVVWVLSVGATCLLLLVK